MPTHNFTLTVNTSSSTWTNSSSALVADGSFATSTFPLESLYFYYSTSVIPSGAIINNITVTVLARAVWAGGTPTIYLREIGSRSFSDGSPFLANPTSTATRYTLLNASGPAISVTADNINALSNLRIRGSASSGSGTFYVDDVTFSVTYTPPVSGSALFFGENF